MTQSITSAATSLKQVPAIVGLIDRFAAEWSPLFWIANARSLDMGGGKFDLTTEAFRERHGVRNLVLDPYNRSQEHNDRVRSEFIGGRADFAICSNVLNVVRESEARRAIHREIKRLTRPTGMVFFTVYEGDKSSRGRKTSKGWQRNLPTKSYVRELKREYNSVTIFYGKLIVCKGFKKN